MRFEEALKAMREGKKVKHSGRSVSLCIDENGDIVENYRTFQEPLRSINVINIM